MENAETHLQQLGNYQTRPHAMDQFRQLGKEAIPPLCKGLDHYSEGVRWASARLLGETSSLAALEVLKNHISDTSMDFQIQESIESIERRLSVSTDNPESEVRAPNEASGLSDHGLMEKAVEGTDWSLTGSSGKFKVKVNLPGERSHTVRCMFQSQEEKGTPLVLIYTECGPATPDLYASALKMNLKLPFGAVALREVDGKEIFVMVNTLLRETISPKSIFKTIERLSKEADSLESQLTGGKDIN